MIRCLFIAPYKKLFVDALFTTTSEAIDVVYWSFTGLQPNVQKVGTNTWQQQRTDGQLTISGWQTPAAGTASLLYEVVEQLNSTTYSIHSSVTVGGNYSKSGTWYTKYISGVGNNVDFRMRFTNKGLYNTDAAGNGYN